MSYEDWTQVGTVEIFRLRIYPLDGTAKPSPLSTSVAVEPGVYPVYRRYDAYRWLMTGRINEHVEKIGDGLFSINGGDSPTGLEVTFPTKPYGAEQFAELVAHFRDKDPGTLTFTLDEEDPDDGG